MKTSQIRYAVIAAILIAAVLGVCLYAGVGTLSGFGIGDIVALCPLGAIETTVASKTIIPAALISLAVAVFVIVSVGKAFCAWVCPVSLVREARERWRKRRRNKQAGDVPGAEMATVDVARRSASSGGAKRVVAMEETAEHADSANEPKASGCARAERDPEKQTPGKRPLFDSRHAILLGSIASAAVFGFPVFCLVCPIGLLFGTVILLCQFFGGVGDVSWSLAVFPLVLVLEMTVLKSWCSKFCPLGALISLVSRANRLLRPKVDTSRCLRMNGGSCERCSESCLEGLDPHFAEGMQDCSKCARCKDACPVAAISFVGRKGVPMHSKKE